ncbi:hypothetical protein ACNIU2_05625, partial [Escherichia coli]
DRNRSHWSTSKTPSYTKSVSWQHHPKDDYILLIKATDYLSSYKAHLLDMHFQYIDNLTEEPIPVEDDLISYALDTGSFYHPETGELVDNFSQYLYPYFTPSSLLESLHE